MKNAYFTICSSNYLAYARTLYASLREADPDSSFDFVLFLADEIEDPDTFPDLPFRVVEARDLDIPTFWDMALRYSIMEFNTAIKPSCFRFLLEKEQYDGAIYLDPDIFVVRPLSHVTNALEAGANLVLTPHITAPLDDGGDPDDIRILRTGCYNLGFLAARRSPDVSSLMSWWAEHLKQDCRVDLENGLFVDQKFMDLAPSICNETHILRHPGYNTAYWNLCHREITRDVDGWHAGGEPLHFFHFSGVVPGNRSVFSKHQNRFTPSNIGALKELHGEYLDNLMMFDHAHVREIPYAYGKFSDGTRLPDIYRAAFGHHHPSRELSRDEAFAPDFDWALEPEQETVGAFKPFPISKLLYEIWLQRPDLKKEFRLSATQDREALVRWFFSSAPVEYGLPPELVGRMSTMVRSDFDKAQEVVHSGGLALSTKSARIVLDNVSRLRKYYRLFPQDFRTRLRSILLRAASSTPTGELSALKLHSRGSLDNTLKSGVSLYGYFQTVSGVGEGARRLSAALSACGIESCAHTVASPDNQANVLARPDNCVHGASPYRTALFQVNADQTEPVLGNIGARDLTGKYRIGYWAWELSRFPDVWHSALDSYDEIWVPSTFVRDAVAKVTEKRVEVVPHPVLARDADAEPGFPGIEQGRFHFLCAADFNSYARRKNLTGAYNAFCKAFPDCSDSDPMFVVKVHGTGECSDGRREVFEHMSSDPRVLLIDSPLDSENYRRLQAACDSFVSLHRSEGFGLNIAECMALGKIVIATGYGGSMDFTTSENCLIVPYTLVQVAESEYPQSNRQVWACPDTNIAAELMRRAAEGGPEIDAIRRNAKRIVQTHSVEAIGEIVWKHLARIDTRFS